jgi:hypothetical protein
LDGVTWSNETSVAQTGESVTDFSIWFDGVYIHYACRNFGVGLRYRRGTPNLDGTITWSANEQSISTQYGNAGGLNISVDVDGYAWIGYTDFNGTYQYPYVIKSGNNDGTWGSNPSGFPYRFSTTSNSWCIIPVPLANGGMLIVHNPYNFGDVPIKLKRWASNQWGTTIETTGTTSTAVSAVAQGNDCHIVFLASGRKIKHVRYIFDSNSLSTETTVKDPGNPVVLSIDSATNDLYAFWANTPLTNHIYYKKYDSSTSTWDYASTDLIDENPRYLFQEVLTCFYASNGSKIGIAYQTNLDSPYNIKFTFLPVFATIGSDLDVVGNLTVAGDASISNQLSANTITTTDDATIGGSLSASTVSTAGNATVGSLNITAGLTLNSNSGVNGQVLTSNGSGNNPTWQNITGEGSSYITSISSGQPFSVSNGALSLNASSPLHISGGSLGLNTSASPTFAGLTITGNATINNDLTSYGALSTSSNPATGMGGGAVLIGHGYNQSTDYPQIILSDSNLEFGQYGTLQIKKVNGTYGNLMVGGLWLDGTISARPGDTLMSGEPSSPGFSFNNIIAPDGYYTNPGIGLNSAGELVLSDYTNGVVTAHDGSLGNTLDDGSGNMNVSGSLNVANKLTMNGNSGTSGQVLTSNGSGNAPTWQTISGGGSGYITSIATGQPFTVSSGALSLNVSSPLQISGDSLGINTAASPTFSGLTINGTATVTGISSNSGVKIAQNANHILVTTPSFNRMKLPTEWYPNPSHGYADLGHCNLLFEHTGSQYTYPDGINTSLFLVMVQDTFPEHSDLFVPFLATDHGFWVEKDIQTYGALFTSSDPAKCSGGGAILMGHGFRGGATCPPKFILTDTLGGGTDAQASLTVSNGVITAVNVTNTGDNYTFADITVNSANGHSAKLSPCILGGHIQSILVHDGGSGYSPSDTISITNNPHDTLYLEQFDSSPANLNLGNLILQGTIDTPNLWIYVLKGMNITGSFNAIGYSSYGYLKSDGTCGYSNQVMDAMVSIQTTNRILCGEQIDVLSDQRDKILIDTLNAETSLDAIKKLAPLHFVWKPETKKGEGVVAGFFAQEVAQAIPEAVTMHKGERYSDEHTLNYNVLTTYALSAIQGLNNHYQDNAKKIDVLTEEIRDLRAMIQQLTKGGMD